MAGELARLSACELAELISSREVKAVEALDDCLDAIGHGNEPLNAFIHLDSERAHEVASEIDRRLAQGESVGPLAGVPIGVKDLEDCEGMPTSQGSLLYKDRPPAEKDALHISRLRRAGAVPIGKTTAPEFGAMNFTRSKAWGVTRNPWNLERTPGGSSGGSAAAVAAGLVPIATASDGGGSTRIPGSFSGLVGFKPSYGRIAKLGSAPSQTSVSGVMCTTVRDAARHLDVTAGPDPRDRTSLPAREGVPYEQLAETLDVHGLRAVWSDTLGFAHCDPEVSELTRAAATQLCEAAGLVETERTVNFTDAVKVWMGSGALDLWTDLERGMWPDRSDELDVAPWMGLSASEKVTPAQLASIHRRRQQFEREVGELFEEVDVLLTPTTAVPAFVAEGPPPGEIAGHDVGPAMSVPFTMLANLCWNPAVSVPAGLNSEGLPVGLQMTVRRHRDDIALRLARLFEQAHPWPRHAP
ncbi:MAG TPA: amidase [Acidimicrobiales bacterium]|nr:amidase [Acidimicrobiales bacterium]